MRHGYIEVGPEQYEEGYFEHSIYEVGDAYESPNSGKLFIVTDRNDDIYGPEGERHFYQMRDATDDEIKQWNTRIDEKADFEDFFSATDFF